MASESINIDEGSAALDRLKTDPPADMRPREVSVRQFVFMMFPKIMELRAIGYSHKQIHKYLQNTINLKCSLTTFNNYINEAGRRQQGGNTSKRGRPTQPPQQPDADKLTKMLGEKEGEKQNTGDGFVNTSQAERKTI